MRYRKYLGGSLFNWMYLFLNVWLAVSISEGFLKAFGVDSMDEVKYVVYQEYVSSTGIYLFSATSLEKDSLRYFFPIVNSKEELDPWMKKGDTLTMRLYKEQIRDLSRDGLVFITKGNIRKINGKRFYLLGKQNFERKNLKKK